MTTTARLLVLVALILAAAGCTREKQRYDGATAPVDAKPVDPTSPDALRAKRIVLFAPVAIGPLAEVYPAARLDYAFALADRVDLVMHGYDGRVGEVLPDADAARWNEGRVPATAGANVVVLAQVVGLSMQKGAIGVGNRPDFHEAVVELRALDVNGALIYRKRAIGQADAVKTPKVVSPDGRPESRAVWDALDIALGDFRAYLSARNELASQPTRLNELPPGELVSVTIDSEPNKADVLIDGAFKGTTPLAIKLPPREVTVRIERQGFQPWMRAVTPSADMTIQPVLAPAAAPAPAAPAP